MLNIKNSTRFNRDLKKFMHQQSILKELNTILDLLIQNIPLDKKYKDHPLSGNWAKRRECHIRPDVLLIYAKDEENLFGSSA